MASLSYSLTTSHESTVQALDHQETTSEGRAIQLRGRRWRFIGSTAERTAWIAIITLLISACGVHLELDRFILMSKPPTLQTDYPLQEFIPSQAFDIVCQGVSLVWMSVVLILHFVKQWRHRDKQTKPLKEQVHLGSYLIYGLCFFALGGIFRKILRCLLFLNYTCADSMARA